jgi:hypothetical protein
MDTIKKTKILHIFLAIIIAVLTTGFLRLQLFAGLPDTDGGFYTYCTQFYYSHFLNDRDLDGMMLLLYPLITSWVYGLDVNQFIVLRLIDGFFAIITSIILFKVILKESGSIFFTVILMTTLLVLMNYIENIGYGFRNSIWIAYLPLFSALLVWQNISKKNNLAFYLIGGLVSLGVLFREPFLVFFLFTGIAIQIGYGWRELLKYLIGSALLGFSVLGFALLFRGGDLVSLINSYFNTAAWMGVHKDLTSTSFANYSLLSLKNNWFICFTAFISLIYLIKLYFSDKNILNINRIYFWLGISLLPLLEPLLKFAWEYHFANCLPGLAGLTAMSWKHLNSQESRIVNTASIVIVSLMSLMVILPTINRVIIKSDHIFSPLNAIEWAKEVGGFRGPETIAKSQYLIAAAKIYELSREDSTFSQSGYMAGLFPLTELLPPTYKLTDLNNIYTSLNFNEGELIKILEKYRPTIIMTTHLSTHHLTKGQKEIPLIIEKSNLYNKVATIPINPKINYGWKAGSIYRLKDFK